MTRYSLAGNIFFDIIVSISVSGITWVFPFEELFGVSVVFSLGEMQQTEKKAMNSEKEHPSPDGTSSSSNSSPTKSRVLVPDSSSLPLARLKTELVEKTKMMESVLELFAKEWERLEACRANVERERNEFESMKAKVAQVHFPQQIKLSIGGTIFETSLQHIRRDQDSMLGAMFSGKGFLVEPNKDGAYFIDRDGNAWQLNRR